jgi:hypothetical protein
MFPRKDAKGAKNSLDASLRLCVFARENRKKLLSGVGAFAFLSGLFSVPFTFPFS